MLLRGRVTAAIPTDRSIDVAGQSAGAVSANAFTGFTSPAATVFTSTAWTDPSTSLKYLKADSSDDFVVTTLDSGRDVEVRTWAKYATIFLRVVGGKAIYFRSHLTTLNGTLQAGIVTGLTSGAYGSNGTFYQLYSNADLAGSVAGYSDTDTEGHVFTFGVSGYDIYANYNGVEVFRIKEYRHTKAGTVALQANVNYGFRDIVVDWQGNAALRSHDPDTEVNLADVGAKTFSATGSITGGTATLVLTSDVGFAVGDKLIVAVGGETGAGARGTRGVGGTWPTLSYANTTAMDADTGQANNTFAWDESSGNVYRWSSGGAAWSQFVSRYYVNKSFPLALVATVTVKNGRTLTLDTNANVTATNAAVYFDNEEIINAITNVDDAFAAITPDDMTITFPEGSHKVSEKLVLSTRSGWTIRGAGKTLTQIVSPNGTRSAQIHTSGANDTTVKDLHLIGNARTSGFGLSISSQTATPVYPPGILFENSDDCIAQDVYVTDVFQQAVAYSQSDDVWVYRVTNYQTEAMKDYGGWQFQAADSTGGGFVDCVIDSAYLIHGFEAFGSNGVTFTRPVGRNATFAMNSAGSWTITDPELTIEANSQDADLGFSEDETVISINTNIGGNGAGVALGGTITNPTIIHEDYINGDSDILGGITVGSSNPNVTINGGYIEYPNANENFGTGVHSTGNNTIIDGIEVVGQNANTNRGSIYLNGTGDIVRNSTAHQFVGGTQENNTLN